MTTRPPSKRGKSSAGGGGAEPPVHPLVRAVEELYARGATPRLVIDARRADVIVPDFLRARWADKLVIDLDASYPLDLAYDETGLHVNLAFSGVVSRCTFGWLSIHRIIDRADGRGIVVPAHEPPAELPPELAYVPEPAVTEIAATKRRPSFSLVSDRDAAPDKTPPVSASPEKEASQTEAKPLSASDEEAKARRAKFRVIDGG